MSDPIKNRYEFVILFDVENGNPNGDPDAGNMPRVDPETGLGIVTDVCLKRKIRNYVETVKEDGTGYRIYVKDGVPLNRSDAEAYAALDVDEKSVKEKKKSDPDLDRKIRDWMCANFYDIRTFGAVMTTFVKAALNCGQVRGPVQLGFARSVEPIVPQEVTITRVAITTEADAEKKGTEMGRKYIVPYGLYRCEGYISANLARKATGFSEEDLSLLWEAILNMFEHDHSAARGKMAVRDLIVFKHNNARWSIERTRRDHGLRLDAGRLLAASSQLKELLPQIAEETFLDALRGLEGAGATLYFSVFDQMVLGEKPLFQFSGRNRRPPQNPINALLSFAYSLLTHDCASALESVGLDSYVGFLHRDRPGRTSLALDLMEELRPCMADRFVLTLVNNRMVGKSDFEFQENGAVFLNDTGRRTFLKHWQTRKKEVLTHPYLQEKLPWGLVPYIQALLLARCLRDDLDAYPPFLWK